MRDYYGDVSNYEDANGRPVTSIYANGDLFVDAYMTSKGALVLAGQDLRAGEYEYICTVAPDDVPRVTAALGGNPGDDVLTLLTKSGERVVREGEKSWLESLGITIEFWSRFEPD